MIGPILAALEGIGGAAGGAAAGAELGGFSKLAGGLTKVSTVANTASDIIGKVAGGLGKVADAAKQFVVGGLNALPAKINEAQQLITSTADNWVKALAAPATTIKQLGDSISHYVRLYNPATAKMFEYRIENTFATIGRTLEPILAALTRSAEKVGDAFAKMRPALDPIGEEVAHLADVLSGGIIPAARELAPLMGAVAFQMRAMTGALKGQLVVINQMLQFRRMLGPLAGPTGGFDENGQSATAAREPRYTSAEDLQRELAKNALQASIPGAETKKDTPTWLETIYNLLKEKIGGLSIEAIAKAIGSEIRNAIPTPSNVIEQGQSWLERKTGYQVDGRIW